MTTTPTERGTDTGQLSGASLLDLLDHPRVWGAGSKDSASPSLESSLSSNITIATTTAMSYIESLFGLSGSLAVVTGGTRGIGQAMALSLASSGADIVLVQRSEASTETKAKIEALGRKATIYVADLGDQESVGALIPKILADGLDPDILVTCAGIQRRYPAHEFPIDEWDAVGFTDTHTELWR